MIKRFSCIVVIISICGILPAREKINLDTKYKEAGALLKLTGPLDMAMKARQGKLVETKDSRRHGGYVRDHAGNLHARIIQSRSIDFNGKFRLTDENHQAGRVQRRKMLATYNSGGIFSITAGGYSPKHR